MRFCHGLIKGEIADFLGFDMSDASLMDLGLPYHPSRASHELSHLPCPGYPLPPPLPCMPSPPLRLSPLHFLAVSSHPTRLSLRRPVVVSVAIPGLRVTKGHTVSLLP